MGVAIARAFPKYTSWGQLITLRITKLRVGSKGGPIALSSEPDYKQKYSCYNDYPPET